MGYGKPCPGSTPSGAKPDPNAYAAFLRRELPDFYDWGVRRFSFWNEPNLNFFLSTTGYVQNDQTKKQQGTQAQADLYYQLYQQGRGTVNYLQKIGRIGHDVEILFGEISAPNNGIGFINMILKNGKIKADGISMHPYQFCTPPDSQAKAPKTMPKRPGTDFVNRPYAESHHWICNETRTGGMGWLPKWNAAVKTWGQKHQITNSKGKTVPLYLTEYGLLRSPWAASVSEDVRVAWFPRAMNWALKNKVKQMLVFQLTRDVLPFGWDSGIIDLDCVTPLPAYNALKNWAHGAGYQTF